MLANKRCVTLALVGALFVALGVMGVGSRPPVDQLADEQILRVALPMRALASVDPARTTTSGTQIGQLIFDGLVRYPVGDHRISAEVEPDLALRWKTSEDNLTWTFYLRKGVKFHRGFGEFTAEDVKFTVERQRTGSFASTYANVREVNVIDDYTVQFVLKGEDIFFLNKLVDIYGGRIVSKKAVEELGAKKFGMEPVGTGPFQFKESIPGERYVLVRNDDYFRGVPILEEVDYYFMPDLTSSYLALLNGEVDATLLPTEPKLIAKAQESENIIVDPDYPLGEWGAMNYNMTKSPFNLKKVRQALSYAICRDDFIDLWGDTATKIYSFVPPFAFGALTEEEVPEEDRYDFNIEKAKQLLAEAGYPNGFKIGDLIVSERPDEAPTLQLIQARWRELGIDMNLIVVDHATMHAKIRQDVNPVVWYNANRAPFADVYLFQFFDSASVVLTPTAATNFSHYGRVDADGDGQVADNSIDDLIAAMQGASSKEEYLQLAKEAQFKLFEDLPAYPFVLTHPVVARADYLWLGYKPIKSIESTYNYTEDTAILKH